MHRIEIPERKINMEFPSRVDELNEKQYICFVALILEHLYGKIDIPTMKILFLRHLLGIKSNLRYEFLSAEEKENIHAEIYRLSELVDSFFKEGEREGKKVKMFDVTTTKNFIPRIRGGYYGPEDAMKNCNFYEFRTAYNFFSEYVKENGDENSLNRLCAVLYRPKKRFLAIRKLFPSFDGQIRRPITAKTNPLLLEKRARKIGKLPVSVRYGIYLFFSGCLEYFRTGCPVVDGKEINFSVLYEKSEEGEESALGMVGLLYSLAETKVFGSIEETDNQNVWDVMVRLYQVVMQSKQIEKIYGSH